MKLVVGTDPIAVPGVGGAQPVIQNLGPGNVYIDNAADASVDSGLKLEVGDVYEMPESANRGNSPLFVVADAVDTDIRIIHV